MAKQYYPLLPKLREDASVNPDKASIWEEESHDFLTALVKSLDVGSTIKDIGHIDSIPDVWARPLLFQMALFDKQNAATSEFIVGLRDRVVGEWRALLAMIALKDIRHIDLRAEAVHLASDEAGLAQVLTALAPSETIAEDTRWTDIYVLFFQGKPIGITSPTTLVSAAADYMTAYGGQLPQPWSADGVMLTDPLPYLTGEEAGALAFWLDKTYDALRALHGSEDNDAYKNLLSVFSAYSEDAHRRASGTSRGYELAASELGTNLGAFRCLNQMVKGRIASAEDSDVKLVASQTRTPEREVLLVAPDMVKEFAESAGIGTAQLVVWPGISANDITDESLQGERNQIGGVSIGKAVRYRPEEFFTDRMVVIEPEHACPQSLDIEGMEMLATEELTPVPPIRRELLALFTPQEIAQRLSFENRDDGIIVKFRFPITGANSITEYRFTKKYSNAGGLILVDSLAPTTEVWPNFRREGWSKYYFFYENTAAQNGEELAKDMLYIAPWASDHEISKEIPEGGLQNRYTVRLDGFPEAFFCSVIPSQDGPAATPIEVGAFLLKEPPSVQREPELTWDLGIDFGTSSTMLYCRADRRAPEPLAFDPHLYEVLDSLNQRLRTFVDFIPCAPVEGRQADGSFLSMFHVLTAGSLARNDIRPLEDGNIFALQLTENYKEILGKHALRIDTDLKWQDDAIGRRKVAAYIQQLCLQCLAEAGAHGVEKLTWNFSFPTAFSNEQQIAFRQTCQAAVKTAYQGTSFELPEEILSWPESKASAYHFNKLGGSDTNFGDGAVCLDIGAGTTDVSIISGQPGEIVYHTSIQFAGRYLFQPIYDVYSIFADHELLDFEGKIPQTAVLDADMREHSEEYLDNLKNLTGIVDIKNALQTSQCAVAGIFYYLGGILKELHERGIYQEDHVPEIFVGGNGSRIFSWLSGGAFAADSPYLQVFRDMLAKASGLEDTHRTEIHISDRPKMEVAAGMIEERPQNDKAFFNEAAQREALFGDAHVDDFIAASVIAGDTYAKDGEELPAESFLSAYDISDGIQVQELAVLRRFLDDFNDDHHIWNEGIDLDTNDLAAIEKRVASYYVAEKGKDVKKIYVEPVFVMGLKKMMEAFQHEKN